MNESKLKKLFKSLQRDEKNVFFTEESINNKVIKRLKKSNYVRDNDFTKLFATLDFSFLEENKTIPPLKTSFVEKKDKIDRSTFYSFEGPFQLLHVDIANLQFLGKSSAARRYCLVVVDIFSSKVYTYPMKSRKNIAYKLEMFYKKIKTKRKKGEKIRLQTNLEFKHKKIFNLNFKCNIDMFSTAIRGGKAFAAEQKFWGLKKRIFCLKSLEKRDGKSKTRRQVHMK